MTWQCHLFFCRPLFGFFVSLRKSVHYIQFVKVFVSIYVGYINRYTMFSEVYNIIWGFFLENSSETQLQGGLFRTGGAVNHMNANNQNKTQEEIKSNK